MRLHKVMLALTANRRVLFSIFLRILGAGVAFFVNVIIARYLSISDAGNYFLALTLVIVFSNLGVGGFNTAAIKYVGGDVAEENWKSVYSVSRFLISSSTCLLVIFSICFYVFGEFISIKILNKPEMVELMSFVGVALLFVGLGVLLAHFLAAVKKTIESTLVLSVMLPVLFCSGVLIFNATDIANFSFLYGLSALATLCFGASVYFRFIKKKLSTCKSDKPNFIKKNRILLTVASLWTVTAMSQLIQWSSQFIAGAWLSSEDFALLAVAQRTSLLVSFILIAINLIVGPKIAGLFRLNDISGLQNYVKKITRGLSIVGAILLIVCALFSENIMRVYGSNFIDASILFLILAAGQALNLVIGPVSYALSACGFEKDLRNISIVSGIFSILVSILLLKMLGVVGGAAATTATFLLQNSLIVFFVKRRLNINLAF